MTRKLSLNNKAFTLIELIVVIAVIGILVLLAMPKFLGYTKDAKLVQIKNDVKTYETIIGAKLIQNDKLFDGWEIVTIDTMKSYANDGLLHDVKGSVEADSIEKGNYHKISEGTLKEGKTKLAGDFIASSGGKVYYYGENLKGNGNIDDKQFEWVKSPSGYIGLNGDKGYFKYIGTKQEVVEIPHVIQGVEIKSYYRMFFQTGRDVKKVVSTNENITDMREMFLSSQTPSLDLSLFETSEVTNMFAMFGSSQAKFITFGEKFDTSKVTNMTAMFQSSSAVSLDLSGFDTSSVTSMSSMFHNSQAIELNMSSFNTSSVTDMNGMFNNAQSFILDLSSFDTIRVVSMNVIWKENEYGGIDGSGRGMFRDSKAEKIILGANFTAEKVNSFSNMFDNSKATEIIGLNNLKPSSANQMRSMFEKSQVKIIDLSSFDTSNVIDTDAIFYKSQATIGYAKTLEDAKKLNDAIAIYSNQNGLTFRTK